jgi:hypothetical protein
MEAKERVPDRQRRKGSGGQRNQTTAALLRGSHEENQRTGSQKRSSQDHVEYLQMPDLRGQEGKSGALGGDLEMADSLELCEIRVIDGKQYVRKERFEQLEHQFDKVCKAHREFVDKVYEAIQRLKAGQKI